VGLGSGLAMQGADELTGVQALAAGMYDSLAVIKQG